MELSFAQQSAAFLWSIPLGAAFGVLYGVFKFLRFAFSLKRLMTAVLDAAFMLVCAVSIFLFSLGMVDGYLRFYVFLGALLGFSLYRLTLGRLLVKIYSPIVRFARNVAEKTAQFFKLILKKLLKNCKGLLYNKSGKKYQNCHSQQRKQHDSIQKKGKHQKGAGAHRRRAGGKRRGHSGTQARQAP